MADPDPNVKESKGVLISGKIMVLSIIMLFAVVVFVMLLNLYAQWFWGHSSRRARARRRRFVFTTDQDPARVQRRGLEPAVIHSLPVFTFQLKKKTLSPDDGHREEDDVGLECAVCLCEFEQGEKARLLPACRHSFHVDCIDMWFHSHSTCPLCRTVVVKHNADSHDPDGLHHPSQEAVLRLSASAETAPSEAAPAVSGDDDGFTFPTNVLFWGNQSRVDSGCSVAANKGDGTSSCKQPHISIDIPPRRIAPAGEVSSPERLTDIDDLATAAGLSPGVLSLKSPTTRMRILGRLLSREKRPSGACASPSGDVEQGADFVRV